MYISTLSCLVRPVLFVPVSSALISILQLQSLLTTLPLPVYNMSRKRPREFSTSPKFHRVTWAEKRTRRGTVLAAEVITASGSAQAPIRPKKTSKHAKFTHDQTPRSSEDINEATFLPPIPVPDILAPKRDRRGKV